MVSYYDEYDAYDDFQANTKKKSNGVGSKKGVFNSESQKEIYNSKYIRVQQQKIENSNLKKNLL